MKVSFKTIEKWLSSNKFVGIDFANVANGDMGDLIIFCDYLTTESTVKYVLS